MSTISALEYARDYGLAIDHTAEDLLREISQLPLTLPDHDVELLEFDFSLFSSELSEPKLQLSHKSGALLAESIRPPQPVINWNDFLPERHRVRQLMIDEPLLTGDHETDVRRFRREVSGHQNLGQLLETCSAISSVSNQSLEDEWNDIERGESARNVERELDDERCHTTKEALAHLSEMLKNKLTDETRAELLSGLLQPVKRQRARSLTPLLMPAEESPEPYVPSSPDLELPLRSDENIDYDSLLYHIEREMQQKDQILSDEAPGISTAKARQLLQEARAVPQLNGEEDLPIEMISPRYAERRQARKELQHLKLEVPILSSCSLFDLTSDDNRTHSNPAHINSSPSKSEEPLRLTAHSVPWKHGSLKVPADPTPDHDSRAILDEFLHTEVLMAEDDEFEDAFDVDLDEELLRLTNSAKAQVDTALEQDKIMAPESCLKLPVPQLEKVSVSPPWEFQNDESLARELDEICLIPSNPTDLQQEIQMNWEAIPSYLMKLGIHDKIEDDGKLCKWVEPPLAVTRSEEMLFKKPGLRLLDMVDESDDEMEGDPELARELSNPVIPTVPGKRREHALDSMFEFPVKKPRVAGDDGMQDLLEPKHSLATNSQQISASNALESFLDLRGGKFKKVPPPRPPTANELMDDPIQPTQLDESSGSNTYGAMGSNTLRPLVDSIATNVQLPSTPNQGVSKGLEVGKPHVMELLWCRTVVFNTTILQKYRSLVNFLETCGKERLNVVYREVNQLGGDNRMRSQPEVILNPTTGLTFTSLQALNQKSLPGQDTAGQSMVQTRLLDIAHEYDRLFVIVTAPSSNGTLPQAQLDTMTTFAGFCANLSSNGNVTVVLIWVISKPDPSAIDEAFNASVWNLICGHAFPMIDPALSTRQDINTVALINDETLWEHFLRRVGLNPMAAQIVIGALRRSELSSAGVRRTWGLRRFVQMRPDQRRDLFVEILGLRAVERINAVLDERWT